MNSDNNKNKQPTQEEIDKKKQNALFNLDFEEYKKQVKKQLKIDNTPEKYLEKIKNLRFPDDVCQNQKDNTYLIIGIILIVFAFILMIFN
jgi:hypothetical protein